MGRYTGKTCRLSAMLILTFGYFFVEIIYGYLTGSMALVADSFHMLSDVLALIIAFFCMKISKKHSSKNTFGWVRAEVLGALVNSVFLLALCFSILVEALKRLFEPEAVTDPINILIVGAVGLAVNIMGIFMFHGHASVHGHSHARPVPLGLDEDEIDEEFELQNQFRKISIEAHSISVLSNGNAASPGEHFHQQPPAYTETSDKNGQNHGHSHNNHSHDSKKKGGSSAAAQLNMHGVFLHILGDAIGSVIVMINAIIVWQVKSDAVAKYLDPSLSIVLCGIIVTTTVPLLRESALILLQTVPTHLNVSMIQEKLLKSIDGVLAVHEFHVWRLAGNKIIASAHIRCRSLEDYMKIAEKVKQFFHLEGIHSTTIQPEFVEEPIDLQSPDSQTVSTAISSIKSKDECILECPPSMCAPSTCCGPSTEVAKRTAAKNRSSSPNPPAAHQDATGLSKSMDRLNDPHTMESQPDKSPPKNRSFSASIGNQNGHDSTTVGGFTIQPDSIPHPVAESERLLSYAYPYPHKRWDPPSDEQTNL